ncbi:hypothetical protein [Sphingomonas sp. M1-B02]|uniref:hypothetical protein n=1 Tax=Sphingomonas sp. M1-B02 TaxID=3114300 RepID=UPI00223F4005|nr:hypothetical protein [Sphingomonas sp. S6-11]UZK66252.1 hypothetical protein OKW87_17380 [Sphingomonas sp. S6-11]
MAQPAPLWLASPSRFATLRRPRARILLGLLALLLLLCLTALAGPNPAAIAEGSATQDQTDLMIYEKIVAGMKNGADYYTAATDALRSGGYPLRPFVTVRMPGLATVQAVLPSWGPLALLFLLGGTVGVVWAVRLGEAVPRVAPRITGAFLLIASMLAFLQPGLAAFHEIWAGLLVALSLALRRPGRWVEAVAIALAAMLIRETAALYVLVMLGFAWVQGERREALGWLAALGFFAVALGAHAYGVAGVTGPSDPASPGWAGLLGYGFFVKSLYLATSLQLLPLWAGSLLVGLAMFGWASWSDPLGPRMAATLAAYAVAIGIFARLDNFYWALMVAPVLLAGLVFVPDALRDLFVRALDRRRITVTRVSR